MEFSWNPNTKPQSAVSTHPFFDVPSFSKISRKKIRTNKLGNSVVYHPRPSSLASGIHPFILVYSTMRGKKFSIYGVHIPRKCIESMHFHSCPSPPFKTPGGMFWKSVSRKTKGVEKTMICFMKIQSKNMKMTWNINFLIFCMICNFSNFS